MNGAPACGLCGGMVGSSCLCGASRMLLRKVWTKTWCLVSGVWCLVPGEWAGGGGGGLCKNGVGATY